MTLSRFSIFKSALLSGAVILTGTGTAIAQDAMPSAPVSSADPARATQQFEDEQRTPRLSPNIEVEESRIQGAPEGAEDVRFVLTGLNIEGVTAYSSEDLAPLYNDKMGQDISLADLYGIAAQMTRKYRNDGYILTQVVVPPQTIGENGTARLRVVEGRVDSVVVNGKEGRATELIRKYAAQIRDAGGPLNIRQLERQLLLINDLPGVSARSVLSRSETQVGASDLTINVERDPFSGLVGVNNYGSRFLGPLQATAAGNMNNTLGLNERISGQVVVAPDDWYELGYVGVGYEQPVFDHGTTFEVFASHTDTEPGYTLEEFDVEGKSQYASVAVEHPFIRSRAQNLTGRIMFDARNTETNNDITPKREDNIRSLRAAMRYDFLDTMLGVGVNSIDLELSQGIDIFGASDEGDGGLTRADGDPQYFKVNAELRRLQRLSNSVNLLLAGTGQWSDDNLLSAEEFGVGGINVGRGYDPSEIVGDKGVAGTIEVQWNEPVKPTFNLVEDYQLYSFYDAGRTWNDDVADPSLERDTITSFGMGMRGNLSNDFDANLSFAIPLNRTPQTSNNKHPRVYFSLNKRF